MKVLVSGCLVGENCRYKGDNCYNERVMEFLKDKQVVVVCPEQLGGLPTPRQPSERVGDKVINSSNSDVTKEYLTGAQKTLEIAQKEKVDLCLLKAKSPSCGHGRIYDGSFSGTLINGDGVTAELLIKNGFKVITEEDV